MIYINSFKNNYFYAVISYMCFIVLYSLIGISSLILLGIFPIILFLVFYTEERRSLIVVLKLISPRYFTKQRIFLFLIGMTFGQLQGQRFVNFLLSYESEKEPAFWTSLFIWFLITFVFIEIINFLIHIPKTIKDGITFIINICKVQIFIISYVINKIINFFIKLFKKKPIPFNQPFPLGNDKTPKLIAEILINSKKLFDFIGYLFKSLIFSLITGILLLLLDLIIYGEISTYSPNFYLSFFTFSILIILFCFKCNPITLSEKLEEKTNKNQSVIFWIISLLLYISTYFSLIYLFYSYN